MKIQSTKFTFIEPEILNRNQFNYYKNLLSLSPKTKIDSAKKDFLEHFGFLLKITIVLALLTLIGFCTPEKWNIEIIGQISGILLFFAIFRWFVDLPSFINYYFERKIYFSSLKKKILSSKTYEEYYKKEPEHKRYFVENFENPFDAFNVN